MHWSVVLLLATTALASSGDRQPEFTTCVQTCDANAPPVSSLPLLLAHWTTLDDCKYQCMHAITDEAKQSSRRIHQYFGKWPFWRLLGVQEPASVAFSLLNLWAHLRGLTLLRRKVPQSHPMRTYYIMWSYISCNTWIWSAVFHTRDKPVTERLDYFSATLVIVASLYVAVVRVFHLYSIPSSSLREPNPDPRPFVRFVWAASCISAYTYHIYYLTFADYFDYGYNVRANVIVGMIHNLLWITYSLPHTPFIRFPATTERARHKYYPKSAAKPAYIAVLTTAASALEVFDFSPWWRVIDAHSLWHLATAPIALLWYDFLVQDALDEGWVLHKL